MVCYNIMAYLLCGDRHMKKVLFIGQFNTLFENTNNYLTKYFNVQACSSDLTLIKNLLIVGKPDVILFSLLGMGEEREDILDELALNHAGMPLICLETSDENIEEKLAGKFEEYKTLLLPVRDSKIVEAICELLGLKYDAEIKVILESEFERKCVLAIDDNAMQLRILNELLKDKYDVLMATSAVKAMTMIGKRTPDLILLDYDMPVCDGKMALQMLREIEEIKEVPVIFLTGLKDAEHINAVLELNPAGYLLKPAKNDMILEEIEKHI